MGCWGVLSGTDVVVVVDGVEVEEVEEEEEGVPSTTDEGSDNPTNP